MFIFLTSSGLDPSREPQSLNSVQIRIRIRIYGDQHGSAVTVTVTVNIRLRMISIHHPSEILRSSSSIVYRRLVVSSSHIVS